MKKCMKKRFGLFLVLVLICNIRVSAKAESYFDSFLRDRGVPNSVIALMTQAQKEYICDSLENGMEFVSYERQEYFLEEDVNVAMPLYESIPEGDLTLSVMAFKMVTSTETYYNIYPSYVWNILNDANKDSFAMTLYPGWEILTEVGYMNLKMQPPARDSTDSLRISASLTASNGYVFMIPSDVGLLWGYYEGHVGFKAKKTSESVTEAISMAYVDDDTSGWNRGYSISIGPLGLSVSINDSEVRSMAGNYSLNINWDDGDDDDE